MTKTTSNVRLLAESAVMIALALVLNMIVFFTLPNGGEVTLFSMLPILLIGIKNGPKWGFGTAFVYSVIQLLLSLAKVMAWGLSPTVLIMCMLFDYLIAYTVLGVSGFFGGGSRLRALLGVCLGIALRFVCHFISGITIWATWADGFASVMLYSLGYNGSYMLAELVLTAVVTALLLQIPQIRKLLDLHA
ncbi:MAG: energy-coupled thiamine transporter ThiT [Oscillospiraceae bacterium]|nr:energy-coupled thiamine transporter ThiT [Oscillospiraceae bacterium]